MIPDYWLYLITLIQAITIDEETIKSCRILALSQFYSTLYGNKNDKHIEWDGYFEIIEKCRTYDKYVDGINELETSLTFPHHELEMCFNAYETLSAKPISKDLQEKYKEALNLYNILKTSTFDKEFFEALMKINNHEIIIINFEYFIGLNYSCKELWKAYINYMKSKNSLAMLNIYRRYIRFFIGDLKMIEEYRNEIERIGFDEDVTDFWIDTIEFEIDQCGLKYAEEIFDRALLATLKKDFIGHPNQNAIIEQCQNFKAHRSLYPSSFGKNGEKEILAFKNVIQKWKEMVSKKYVKSDKTVKKITPAPVSVPLNPTIKFEPSTAQMQYFDLPLSYIYQILKSANPEMLFKLFASCKSLFKFYPTPLCYQLGVNDEVNPQYFQHSLFLPISYINFSGLQKLHIVNSLDWIVETDRKALSKVIPKLRKCSAKFIHIDSQDLTIDEFKFITANMQILHICNTNIYNSEGKVLSNKEVEVLTSGIIRYDNNHL
uniref:F-box domain-containing protein n=1 Tax=Panagrolaimus davidi TaxID=227884 RepID=A0A914PWQ0_9BILA